MLFVHLTAAMRILCAFAENAFPWAKWGPPWIVEPYARVVRLRRGGAEQAVSVHASLKANEHCLSTPALPATRPSQGEDVACASMR